MREVKIDEDYRNAWNSVRYVFNYLDAGNIQEAERLLEALQPLPLYEARTGPKDALQQDEYIEKRFAAPSSRKDIPEALKEKMITEGRKFMKLVAAKRAQEAPVSEQGIDQALIERLNILVGEFNAALPLLQEHKDFQALRRYVQRFDELAPPLKRERAKKVVQVA